MKPIRKCGFCGKETEIKARGLCGACYSRYQRRGAPEYIKIRKYCSVDNCNQLSEAHGLCSKHLKRWQRHGHTELTRDNGWGSREKHPLYGLWTWRKRKKTCSLCPEWQNDFWKFVFDVGEKPGNNYKLERIDKKQPYSCHNFEWVKCEIEKRKTETEKEYLRRFQKEYRKSIKGKQALKNAYLKKQYGITLDEYDPMLEQQKGVCAICGEKETNLDTRTGRIFELAVDHCHETGKVRGLLCTKCNTGLGAFKDSVELLNKAINYLQILAGG